jgi:glycosyltransferase involved in cell wall biosynthesis/dTDP-4-dehydrorhamnose 3,5-epimerase-like enzyme
MNKENPDLSLVMPCYNEEASLREIVVGLLESFMKAQINLQLVLVDNGSTDHSGEIIDKLVKEGLSITKVTVEVNQGYGYGILKGFKHCKAPLIGFVHADGQISGQEVIRIYRSMLGREDEVLAKAKRKIRKDGLKRRIISFCYNLIMFLSFGNLGATDLNASPKILSRINLDAMKLVSKDWFLDPELMLKAKYLGLTVIETEVESQKRQGGESSVNLWTCLEFFKNILIYRIGNPLRAWKSILRTGGANVRLKSSERKVDLTSVEITESFDGQAHYSNQGKSGEIHSANSLDRIHLFEQKRHEDNRGFLQKVLTASQCKEHQLKGEVYVTTASPGQVKGNHFHCLMNEWFSVIQGEGIFELCIPDSGQKRSIPISSSRPCTLFVPAGVAHALVNTGECQLICIAVADMEHDPSDVFPYNVRQPFS